MRSDLRGLFLSALLLLPGVGLAAATLKAESQAGDNLDTVANCLAGAHPAGPLSSQCTDSSGELPNFAYSASSASYASGISARAWASGTVGTLRVFSQADIPPSDGFQHQTTGEARVELTDSLDASSALGTVYNNYKYTVTISGSQSPNSPNTFVIPQMEDWVDFYLNISSQTCSYCYAQKVFHSTDAQPTGTISGMLTDVPLGTVLDIDLTFHTFSQVATQQVGQSGSAKADYSDTAHFYLDAATPGANTVSTGGFDYATPVPELPASLLLLLGAGSVFGLRAGRRGRR